MSCNIPTKNGLLLLLQAARELDKEPSLSSQSKTVETHHFPSRSLQIRSQQSPTSYYCSIHRGETSARCTHNELEKSRRSHLRNCIEELKEHLLFDNDLPRITMLTVLRKATTTIHMLRQKNEYLESCEAAEKLRCAALLKRRQSLRRKLDSIRCRKKGLGVCLERNRTFSECSFLTTSSDDSEMDLVSKQFVSHKSKNNRITIRENASFQDLDSSAKLRSYESVMCPLQGKPFSLPSGYPHNQQGCVDIFDACSSDSGFEEINGQSANEARILPTVELVGK